MINFQRRYTELTTKRKQAKGAVKLYYRISRELTKFFTRLILPTCLKLTANKYRLDPIDRKESKSPKIIVSLCSFPVRLNTLWIVVELLMRQTVKPDMIVLHLSKEQVPSIDRVPKSLRDQQARGLQIKLVEGEDLKSYKKFFYIMKEHSNDIVITVDDDIFYPYNTIESLIDEHKLYPNDVIANRTRAIKYDEDGEMLPYSTWKIYDDTSTPCTTPLLQTGISGVLYPPHSLHPDVLNRELFVDLAPLGDDIWLYAMTRLNGNVVRRSKINNSILAIRIKNNMHLYNSNVSSNFNDVQVNNIRKYYKDKSAVDLFAK